MNKQAVVTIPQSAPMNSMEFVDRAMASGNIEVLKVAMDLHERWEKNQARKAFDEAISAAKAEMGPIEKNRQGHNYRYADIAQITSAAVPIMSQHGLSHRYRINQTDRITVTCVISHKLGHYEETTLAGAPDKTGSKNEIQSIGSTVTYLQRYTLIAALGLSITNDDTDGTPPKRENPHVTRPEDLSDARPRYDDNGNRIDWIDTSEHRVERLMVSKAKPKAELLNRTMYECKTAAELIEWSVEKSEQVAMLPVKWEEILQNRFQEYLDELRRAVPHNANILKAG